MHIAQPLRCRCPYHGHEPNFLSMIILKLLSSASSIFFSSSFPLGETIYSCFRHLYDYYVCCSFVSSVCMGNVEVQGFVIWIDQLPITQRRFRRFISLLVPWIHLTCFNLTKHFSVRKIPILHRQAVIKLRFDGNVIAHFKCKLSVVSSPGLIYQAKENNRRKFCNELSKRRSCTFCMAINYSIGWSMSQKRRIVVKMQNVQLNKSKLFV